MASDVTELSLFECDPETQGWWDATQFTSGV